jgi:hypothetical protein
MEPMASGIGRAEVGEVGFVGSGRCILECRAGAVRLIGDAPMDPAVRKAGINAPPSAKSAVGARVGASLLLLPRIAARPTTQPAIRING